LFFENLVVLEKTQNKYLVSHKQFIVFRK